MTSSKPGGDRSYKRSWKNLLINKRYQLRFTLFMVGLTSLLMVGLGIWVMRVANETTEVSMASVRGEACPKVPSIGDASAPADDEDAPHRPSMKLDEPGEPAPAAPAAATPTPAPAAPAPAVADPAPAAGSGAPVAGSAAPAAGSAAPAAGSAAPAAGSAAPAAAGDDEPRHVQVQIDESSMTFSMPADFVDKTVQHWTCELLQTGKMDRLEHGRIRILWAMILTGLLLVFGLAVYGIKMTHRVAGPLFKVSLYLAKMRAGRLDKVYNLRKGDQLVEFYDHFKLAHGGVVTMQRDDIARLAQVIAAAEAAGQGSRPEVAALREQLARKEKSIE